MRKMFRFKYEPCKGTCYAWCDSLPEELNKYSDRERKNIVTYMVETHDHLCDNQEYSFGIDRQDETGMFVGHFRTPKATDTFLDRDFMTMVGMVCAAVMREEIPKVSGTCDYGDNGAEDLGSEILRVCTDLVYREEHHKECPCSVNESVV